MRLKRIVATTAVFGMLAGCGASDGEKPESPSPSQTTASPTPDVPKVSEKTICDLLFSGDENPMNEATDMVSKFANDPDATSVDEERAAELAATLRSLSERAPESLAPHLAAEADFLENLNEAAASGTVSFETFKSSGLEISNVCVPLL